MNTRYPIPHRRIPMTNEERLEIYVRAMIQQLPPSSSSDIRTKNAEIVVRDAVAFENYIKNRDIARRGRR